MKSEVLDSKDWEKIFPVINKGTINQPYPGDARASTPLKGVSKPNHDVTHATRQVRLFETLHDLLPRQPNMLDFTPEEVNSLKLAAYCYNAGRASEGDDQCQFRSAQVYAAYAQQLGLSDEIIQWTFEIMAPDLSSKPLTEQQDLAHRLLTTSQRLDLFRYYSDQNMLPELSKIQSQLKDWQLEGHTLSLVHYAKALIINTGGKQPSIEKQTVDYCLPIFKCNCSYLTGSTEILVT